MWTEMAAGGRFVLERPGLVGLTLIFAGINFFAAFTYYSILPALILARSGGSRMALGSVQGVLGGAGVAGGVLMSVWGGPRRRIHGVLAAAAVSFILGDLLFALGRSTPVWLLAAFLSSVFVPIITGSDQAIWQTRVPPGMQGRVLALVGMVRRAPMALGYLAGGVVADRWFEPAMAHGGWLAPALGPLVGTGPGAGMAALFLVSGVLGMAMSLAGYLFPAVRDVETEGAPSRPDHS
jgi:predicted MFS family arabinose efflux permease